MAEPDRLASEIQEDDDMELQLLLSGPANEANMHELLGGTLGPTTLQQWNTDGESSIPDNEMKNDFAKPSILPSGSVQLPQNNSEPKDIFINLYNVGTISCCFLAPWTRGRRGSRMRSRMWSVEISHLFGSPKPPACGGGKSGGKKKTKRWTYPEAEKLVEGVYEYGVGNWTDVKRAYFLTSFRKPVHLKDKWRDFVRACGIQVGSKKEVQPQRATLRIIKGLKKKIVSIYRKHAAENRRT